jgi:hypothetical protein
MESTFSIYELLRMEIDSLIKVSALMGVCLGVTQQALENGSMKMERATIEGITKVWTLKSAVDDFIVMCGEIGHDGNELQQRAFTYGREIVNKMEGGALTGEINSEGKGAFDNILNRMGKAGFEA